MLNIRHAMTTPVEIHSRDEAYPPSLGVLGEVAPERLWLLGNADILQRRKLALFGSVRCPAALILQAHDLAQALKRQERAVVSGFHAPVEKEVLAVLLGGSTPLVIGVTRGLKGMRLPSAWRKPLEEGRLLLLSAFEGARRVDARLALQRNRLLAVLADEVLVIHAAQGGKSEVSCRELVGWQKPVYALAHSANEYLRHAGVKLKSLEEIAHHECQ